LPKDFSGLRIVVIGDAILDNYTLGKVRRVSPEAPVPVLDIEEQFYSLGGAGNVWMNLRQLGVKAELVTAVGNDPEGSAFEKLLEGEGGSREFVWRQADAVTTEKRRFVDTTSNYHLLRADMEEPLGFSDCTFDVLECLQTAMRGQVDALVISDYRKGLFDESLAKAAVQAGKEKGCLVVADTKCLDWSQFAGADWLTPNLAEVEAATGAPISGENNLRAIAKFAKDKGIGGLVVTMGAKGLAVCHGDSVTQFSCDNINARDVTGAGDVVLAYFAAALASDSAPKHAAGDACLNAAASVEKEGPCILDWPFRP
jgi:D-beta-D-heptose 7-phosphate kinase/D-beta-D-heptose 1-phosphate adenosyltransferase